MKRNGKWNDVPCDKTIKCLCEIWLLKIPVKTQRKVSTQLALFRNCGSPKYKEANNFYFEMHTSIWDWGVKLCLDILCASENSWNKACKHLHEVLCKMNMEIVFLSIHSIYVGFTAWIHFHLLNELMPAIHNTIWIANYPPFEFTGTLGRSATWFSCAAPRIFTKSTVVLVFWKLSTWYLL